ncbi:MAG: universal stress protein [Bacteroidota bacterium]
MSLPFKKIIVCLDHSDKDQEVVESACSIAKISGTEEMIFLNVIKDFQLPEKMKKEFPDLLSKALEERKKELDSLVDSFWCLKIKKRLEVKQGSVTREIMDAATRIKSDLIIMGKNNDGDSLLTARIARKSPCNLLLLPPKKKLKFDRILIPVDFSDYSELSLKQTMALTQNFTSEIFLHNIISVPSSYRYSGKTSEEFAEIIQGHAEKDLEILTRKIELKNQSLVPSFTVEHGENVIDLVWAESKRKKVDLIVMGAKGRTVASTIFIGSKTERMIRVNDKIPLMIIRKKGAMAGVLETLRKRLD